MATAQEFTAIASSMRGSGVQTGFHCHDQDMKPLSGGDSAWNILASHTPQDFVMQYDTGNGVVGGADPVQPILQFPGRSGSVHLKEAAGPGAPAITNTGQVPWAQVFQACESVGGTTWYVVEAEIYGDFTSMEVVKKCFDALQLLGKV